MSLYVGTSGYSYKEWKGSFYPEKLAAKDMLPYYSSKLPAVELNNTFYRMPQREHGRELEGAGAGQLSLFGEGGAENHSLQTVERGGG